LHPSHFERSLFLSEAEIAPTMNTLNSRGQAAIAVAQVLQQINESLMNIEMGRWLAIALFPHWTENDGETVDFT
jgi:hypothetical protein